MKKILLLSLIFSLSFGIVSFFFLSSGTTSSTPWTREKARHLAEAVLFHADDRLVDTLYQAGSAARAVDILFPDRNGGDRAMYEAALLQYTSTGFNGDNQSHANRYYQMKYVLDPYESKRKLFSLFEDIYAVNRGDTISYKDISDQHDLIYSLMFGSYETFVKRLLYNNGSTGDYAEGAFLNLFNQTDPNNPNENYARELLQLFLMGEYEPLENKENNDERNYTESDVYALARLLTGLKADPLTHQVTIDPLLHYTGANVLFLTGSLPANYMPPFYNALSGTINSAQLLTPSNGNNGLTDNVIEYIFAKRSHQIALFLADRIYRFYIHDTPTRDELDVIAGVIERHNFDMFLSVKEILTLDLIYSEKSLGELRYKTPLELYIGTIKRLQNNSFSGMILDPNLYDTGILPRLNWTPYFPGSVFGRDGFDDSLKWNNTSIQNGWTTLTSYFVYRGAGTGVIDYRALLGDFRREMTTGIIPIMSHADNSYTGTMIVQSGTIHVQSGVQIVLSGSTPIFSLLSMSMMASYDTPTSDSSSDNFASPDIPGYTYPEMLSTDEGIQSDEVLGEYTILSLDTPLGIPDTVSPQTEIIESESLENISDSTGILDEDIGFSGSLSDTSFGITSSGTFENTGMLAESEPPLVSSSGSIIDNQPLTGSLDGASGSEQVTLSMSEGIMKIAASPVSDSLAPLALTEPIILSEGTVSFPTFQIVTPAGTIRIFSGSYNADSRILSIYSGALMNGQTGSLIVDSNIEFTPASRITADMISPETIYETYRTYLLQSRDLPPSVRERVIRFLSVDTLGRPIPIAPTNTNYMNTRIRGLLSILLSSPEYVIRKGWNLPESLSTSSSGFLDTKNGKILFIEFGGGNDYLSSVIPQDEYDTYLRLRTNQSGTIALPRESLVPIGDYYLNPYLAYGSGGNPGFKSLYDTGYMKFFNRVGTLRHSQDHSAASYQMSSYGNTTDERADGIFGHLIARETSSLNTISLGARLPNVYRSGRFVNMGGDIIISNPFNSRYTAHLDFMSELVKVRSFPGETADMFRNAIAISDSAKISSQQGGPRGATGDMYRVFDFLKVLLANNIGKSFYMSARGGYDTHENQYNALNSNLRFVADSVTQFFNTIKDTQDITIVLYSEFGRTNKVNTTMGTDHGDGGGIYVISSNPALRMSLPDGTYGNMILEYLRGSGLGVGIDYRSVYGKIYEALYGLRAIDYFGDPHVSLERDISLAKNQISLSSMTHRIAYGNTLYGYLSFTVDGENYDHNKAGYTTIMAGTGTSSLQNIWDTRITSGTASGQYRFSTTLVSDRHSVYRVRSLSNQYMSTEYLAPFTGTTLPVILPRTVYQVSQTGSSLLSAYNDISVPMMFMNTGILLQSSDRPTIVTLPDQKFAIQFASGVTRGTELTTTLSGGTKWYGGFIFGEAIDRELFWSPEAYESGTLLSIPKEKVSRIQKIGPDRRGVGMKLNQPVTLIFTEIPDNTPYRIFSSEDGIIWTSLMASGTTVTRDSQNQISITTDHFSYFALVADTVVSLPSCTLSASPRSLADGSTSLLLWGVSHVQSGNLQPLNLSITTTGSLLIIPPGGATTEYILTVQNPSGINTCRTSITSIPVSTGTGTTNTGTTSTGTITPLPPMISTGSLIPSTGAGGPAPTVSPQRVNSLQNQVPPIATPRTYTQVQTSLSVALLDSFLEDPAFDRIFRTPDALHKKIAFLVRIARYDILRAEKLGQGTRASLVESLDTIQKRITSPDKQLTVNIFGYYVRYMSIR